MSIGIKQGLIAVLFLAASALARPEYMDRIPNGDNVPNWPAVGHVDPNAVDRARNQFGKDFTAQKKKWTKTLCMMDSDNDGRTNGEELGDPKCVWKVGAKPARTTGITNPGIKDDFSGSPDTETSDDSADPGSESNSTTGTEAHDAHDMSEPLEPWKIAHAVFMAVSFGFIIPLSTLAPYFFRKARSDGKWRNDHINLMYFGIFLGMIGFLVAVFAMGVEKTLHGIVGVVLMILIILQGLLGYFRARIPGVFKWKKIHSIVGRGLVLLTAFQIFFGYLEVNEHVPITGVVIGLIHFGLVLSVFIAIMRAFRNRQKDGVESLSEEPLPADFAPLTSIAHARSLQLN